MLLQRHTRRARRQCEERQKSKSLNACQRGMPYAVNAQCTTLLERTRLVIMNQRNSSFNNVDCHMLMKIVPYFKRLLQRRWRFHEPLICWSHMRYEQEERDDRGSLDWQIYIDGVHFMVKNRVNMIGKERLDNVHSSSSSSYSIVHPFALLDIWSQNQHRKDYNQTQGISESYNHKHDRHHKQGLISILKRLNTLDQENNQKCRQAIRLGLPSTFVLTLLDIIITYNPTIYIHTNAFTPLSTFKYYE
jgi:hypothetical protein